VLGFDHYCPLVGNAVGAANHRSFLQFLLSVQVRGHGGGTAGAGQGQGVRVQGQGVRAGAWTNATRSLQVGP
jgi:hypothetical protein